MERVDERFVLRGQGQGCQQNTPCKRIAGEACERLQSLTFPPQKPSPITLPVKGRCLQPVGSPDHILLFITNSLLSTNPGKHSLLRTLWEVFTEVPEPATPAALGLIRNAGSQAAAHTCWVLEFAVQPNHIWSGVIYESVAEPWGPKPFQVAAWTSEREDSYRKPGEQQEALTSCLLEALFPWQSLSSLQCCDLAPT